MPFYNVFPQPWQQLSLCYLLLVKWAMVMTVKGDFFPLTQILMLAALKLTISG